MTEQTAFWEEKRFEQTLTATVNDTPEIPLETVLEDIYHGRVTRKILCENDMYHDIYNKHRDAIERAILYAQQTKSQNILRLLETNKIKLDILYVQDKNVDTRTHLLFGATKQFENHEVYHDPQNDMSNYDQELVILLDEYRSYTMDVDDWLDVLDACINEKGINPEDPYTKHKVLMITSYMSPNLFFKTIAEDCGASKSVAQTIRHIFMHARVLVIEK